MQKLLNNPIWNSVYDNLFNQWGILFLVALLVIPFVAEKVISKKTEKSKKIVWILRMIMLWAFLFFVVKDIIFSETISKDSDIYQGVKKVLEGIFAVIFAYITYNIIEHIIEIKVFTKKSGGGTQKGIKWLSAFTIGLITFIALVNISGLSEIFSTGTIVGMTGLFLGLTSSIWFPDLFAGLVIIFSNIFQEEQVIEIEELDIYGIVDKIGVFNTTFRNYVNNHKVTKANSEVIKATINNLSRLSSAKGLREKLVFKIGYMKDGKPLPFNVVEDMCKAAFEKAQTTQLEITILFDRGYELFLVEPGDHALEFHLYYYSKDIKLRLQNRYNLYRLFYAEAVRSGIGLNTPITHEILAVPEKVHLSVNEIVPYKKDKTSND